MKYLLFYRESNNFDDILKDPSIKHKIRHKLTFSNHLMLGCSNSESDDKIVSYIMLKYGDDVKDINNIIPDRTPVMNVDYIPKRK